MVLFPQRRGRGRSDGEYAEGLAADGSGYSCAANSSLAGADRALDDLDTVLAHVLRRSDVQPKQLVVAGVSRGGAVAVAFSSRHPRVFSGVVNFVGGWMREGCENVNQINPVLLRKGANSASPSMWFYGDDDPYYGLIHSKANFDA